MHSGAIAVDSAPGWIGRPSTRACPPLLVIAPPETRERGMWARLDWRTVTETTWAAPVEAGHRVASETGKSWEAANGRDVEV
jgi:hypothetical protein